MIVKGSNLVPAPEGMWPAICIDVIDEGMLDNPFKPGTKTHKVTLKWQIEEINQETGKRFTAQRRFTASIGPKSKLGPFLEMWRGRSFTPAEVDGFELENVVGAPCNIQILHKPTAGGGVWPNVQAAIPLMKGVPPLRAVDYVRVKDRPVEGALTASGPSDAELDDDSPVPF